MDIVKKEEVLDIEVIESINSIEQADEILEMCNSQDSKVLDIYVHNAITRGAVYHKLTEVGSGGLGLYNKDIAERYNIGTSTIDNYINIFKDSSILIASQHVGIELNPTLRSLLETIAKDPNKVSERILQRISHNKMSADTERKLLSYLDNADEEVRYEYSRKGSVSNGKLLQAFESGDRAKVLKVIKLNGNSIAQEDFALTRKECRDALSAKEKEIEELKEENEILRRRNKFLLDSNSVSTVRDLLRRANRNKEGMKKLKPEIINAINTMGVDVSVTESELKKAYRAKVGEAHPDVGGSDEEFRVIAEANKLIKNFIKGL